MIACVVAVQGTLRADEPSGEGVGPATGGPALADPAAAPAEGREGHETVVRGRRPASGTPGRDTSVVSRREMEERLPRSAPDALRYEPGVFVQQTAHGQGSAFVRGRTGQQTLLMFDGIRLNTSTFRQGPNQYFFTIDSRTVRSIEVIRGGASTLYGTDAIGGVLDARPIEPPPAEGDGRFRLHPGLSFRGATADGEAGGRVQAGLRFRGLGFLGGVGARKAGLLEGGGAVRNPADGGVPQVPRLAADGRHQLGTGFTEMASDGRMSYDLGGDRRLVAAVYDYREFDAPRTDQCPPAYAAIGECMRYAEQFRTLAYAAFEGDLGTAARRSRFTLSYQRQHERRVRDRPASSIVNGGRDDVDTFGVSARLSTADFWLAPWLAAHLLYGFDAYHDRIWSDAWLEFTDVGSVLRSSRGQYLDGSHYTTGGAYAMAEATFVGQLTLRAGARLGGAGAVAPGDPESGTAPVDRSWPVWSATAGVQWDASPNISLLFNVDRSFRTPNLDDLTSRQQTGPGFQFENPGLDPESSLTIEAGVLVDFGWIEAEVWAYRSSVHDAIERAPREASDCPPETPQCASSWSRFQLVNLSAPARIFGADGSLRAFLPLGFDLRATLSWAWGEGPNPAPGPTTPSAGWQSVQPLSRVPPLNGTVEARWVHRSGGWLGAGLRWAAAQDRLSISDQSDARIPTGGTPGFAVLDLRAGLRVRDLVRATVVFENVTDAAYRYHGSSVNGPGRGFVVGLDAEF